MEIERLCQEKDEEIEKLRDEIERFKKDKDEDESDEDSSEDEDEEIEKEGDCCLCDGKYVFWGNNPAPLKCPDDNLPFTSHEKCCNSCNEMKVIPARFGMTMTMMNA